MIKRITSFILSAILLASSLLCLSSCHGAVKRSGFEMPEKFDETKNYEITFWAKNDTNITQVNIYKKAIADFEALYPNIKVNLKLYTNYNNIYYDVITNIATDTTPNVCISYPDHIATYLSGSDIVVPLDFMIDDEKYGLGGSEVKFDSPTRDEMVKKFLEECSFNSHIYAMPFMRSTEACYVNKDYVEKLGFTLPEKLTWDFIWEVSEAAMKKSEDGTFSVNGQKVLIPFIYKSTDNMMIQMLEQLDAGYSTEEGEVLLFSEETREILEEIYTHGYSRAFSTFSISSYPANFFNAGQCIFAVDSTAGATWVGSDAPLIDIPEDQLVDFETVVMEIPQYNTDSPKMISQGPSMCIFNKEDKGEVLASWLFMQYLLTNDVQIAYSSTEGYLPVTQKALDSDEYKEYLSHKGENNDLYYSVKIDAAELLLDNLENTFVTFVFDGSARLREAAGELIERVVKRARLKKAADDEFYDTLYKEVNALKHLDEIDKNTEELGPLPTESKLLLFTLLTTWGILGGIFIVKSVKKRKTAQKS